MTPAEFESFLRKKTLFDRIFNYCIIGMLVAGPILAIILFQINSVALKASASTLTMLMVFLLSIGLLAAHAMQKRYLITWIDHRLPVDARNLLLSRWIEKLQVVAISEADTLTSFTYAKNFWSTSYRVWIFLGTNTIGFACYPVKHVMDFGQMRNRRELFRSQLETLIAESSPLRVNH